MFLRRHDIRSINSAAKGLDGVRRGEGKTISRIRVFDGVDGYGADKGAFPSAFGDVRLSDADCCERSQTWAPSGKSENTISMAPPAPAHVPMLRT